MSFATRAIGLCVVLGCALAWLMWGALLGITADATDGDVSLWVYDADAVRGETVPAHVRVDSGQRVAITDVEIRTSAGLQRVKGNARTWGSTIESRGADAANDVLDFQIVLPDAEATDVAIRVRMVSARQLGVDTFENARDEVRFDRTIALHSSTTSLLRRAGRGALALAMAAAAILILVRGRRSYAKREVEPSNAWVLALVPYIAIGYLAFAHLACDATHLHGLVFMIAFVVIWLLLLAAPGALAPRAGLRVYTVSSPMIASAGGEAYRSADVAAVTKPTLEVESALMGAGFRVVRKKQSLVVDRNGWGTAYVEVPATEIFGDAPWVIRSGDRNTVMKMLEAAVFTLGDLVCHNDREAEPMRFYRRPL